mmetsp:Transcript_45719/g.97472  ORF Transcript_45719/g.97472 Transcript_45719/m.97472 type:complete len:192 (+) Transcript_45719:124-699(+)|eukprot:CAMPEP_0183339836 /NCGR_PEP_ID=MMETSP0164_2-20130417/6617_1 /TAXON_ID=221442 /ORGANISM="Coccolithus pelagicus ssp braarudi, Strain PLY182g" /LENGTH=191 /DNA_ID=CAMNT_0025509899 /DNA_START=115 /DNA_END=690 /DNA_ORIENTATION=-
MLACLSSLKTAVKKMKHELVALYYAASDPACPWLSRLITVVALGYALSPIDLIPDFIPILGIIDDLILLPMLFWCAIKLIPLEVMTRARERAAKEPLRLQQNVPAAIFFGGIWLGCLLWLISESIDLLGRPDVAARQNAILMGATGAFVVAYGVSLMLMLRKPSQSTSDGTSQAEQLQEELLAPQSYPREV